MTEDKNLKKLRLDPVQTPEDAARTMGDFYATVGNCALNMAIALDKIAFFSEQIVIELGDIKDNLNKQGLSEGWLNPVDIEEREVEEENPGHPNGS